MVTYPIFFAGTNEAFERGAFRILRCDPCSIGGRPGIGFVRELGPWASSGHCERFSSRETRRRERGHQDEPSFPHHLATGQLLEGHEALGGWPPGSQNKFPTHYVRITRGLIAGRI